MTGSNIYLSYQGLIYINKYINEPVFLEDVGKFEKNTPRSNIEDRLRRPTRTVKVKNNMDRLVFIVDVQVRPAMKKCVGKKWRLGMEARPSR